MAGIRKDNAQEKALEEITEMLQEVQDLNSLITSANPIALLVNRKRSLTIEEGLQKRIKSVLIHQRSRRVKDISAKAAKYRLELNDKEQHMISDEAVKDHVTDPGSPDTEEIPVFVQSE